MIKRARRKHTAAFKAKMALAALSGEKTLAAPWHGSLRSTPIRLHLGNDSSAKGRPRFIDAGKRFFRKCAHQGGVAERKAIIDRGHALSIKRQAQLIDISRSGVYYQPRPISTEGLELIRRIDALHLEHPVMDTRMLRDQLCRAGYAVGRKHVGTLMKRMAASPRMRFLFVRPALCFRLPSDSTLPVDTLAVRLTVPVTGL